MRVADFIIKRFQFLGLDTAFLVTGGGAMHLNDALLQSSTIEKIYCHHEQACSIAAESYARVARKPAIVNVTTGPGAINSLNGVFGAYTDSIPMIVVSGQVKTETLRDFNPIAGLRQLGDQEVNILEMAKPITKWRALVKSTEGILELIDKAYLEAINGRPGPVWLDVPVDIQGLKVDDEQISNITRPLVKPECQLVYSAENIKNIFDQLKTCKRPVIFAGTGVRISNTESDLLKLAELLNIPVVTAWTHDVFPNEHRLFAGRPGTIGTRAGNFVVQQADCLLILGSRLNVRQVSYNYKSFASKAVKLWVDIDSAELDKPFVNAEFKIQADLSDLLPRLVAEAKSLTGLTLRYARWVNWCQEINSKYTPQSSDYPVSMDRINPYHFIEELFDVLEEKDVVVCANATATIVPYQIAKLKKDMLLISNSGAASMGYELPAALGACIADRKRRVICLAGDGSIMMNIQELQTLRENSCNVKIFILENDGYLSIKQTQRNFFGREGGASSASKITFPDFEIIATAFGFSSISLRKESWKTKILEVLRSEEATVCCVPLDLVQEFEPRLKSKMADGVIVTPELDDMYPFLDSSELNSIRQSAIDL